MPKFLVLVLTEPTEGKEAEFHDWYENVHLDEVLKTAGWSSAQRFRLAGQTGEGAPLPYLASYEAEGDGAEAVIAHLNDTRAQRRQTDALKWRTSRLWVFEQIGEKHER